MLSETKLAIDDLYERTKEQNKKKAFNNDVLEAIIDGTQDMKAVKTSHDEKNYAVKLHALQFRVLDLEDIIKFEGDSKKKKTMK